MSNTNSWLSFTVKLILTLGENLMRWVRGVIIGIVAGLVVYAIVKLISYINEKRKGPVEVSPAQINLRADEWDVMSMFSVHNRTEEMLYEVYLKLVIEGRRRKANNIEIEPKTGPGFVSVNLSDISVNFDFVRLDGLDSGGRECVFLILYRLAPKATESFVMKLRSDQAVDTKPARIVLKVTKYSKKPAPLLSKKGIGFSFEIPENFVLKRTLLLMKRMR